MIETFFSKRDTVILFYNYQNTSFVHFMEYNYCSINYSLISNQFLKEYNNNFFTH